MFSVACRGAQACGLVSADGLNSPLFSVVNWQTLMTVESAQSIQSWLESLAEPLPHLKNPACLRLCGELSP